MRKIFLGLSLLSMMLVSCGYSETTLEQFMTQVKSNEKRENQPNYTKAIETRTVDSFEVSSSNSDHEASLISFYAYEQIYVGSVQTYTTISPDAYKVSATNIPGISLGMFDIKYYINNDGGTKITFSTSPNGTNKTTKGVYDKYNYTTYIRTEQIGENIKEMWYGEEVIVNLKIVLLFTLSYS